MYFDGKCVSHCHHPGRRHQEIRGRGLARRNSPSTPARLKSWNAWPAACEYKLAGSNEWRKSGPGEKFSVPGNSSFEIRVAQAYHYICHFG